MGDNCVQRVTSQMTPYPAMKGEGHMTGGQEDTTYTSLALHHHPPPHSLTNGCLIPNGFCPGIPAITGSLPEEDPSSLCKGEGSELLSGSVGLAKSVAGEKTAAHSLRGRSCLHGDVAAGCSPREERGEDTVWLLDKEPEQQRQIPDEGRGLLKTDTRSVHSCPSSVARLVSVVPDYSVILSKTDQTFQKLATVPSRLQNGISQNQESAVLGVEGMTMIESRETAAEFQTDALLETINPENSANVTIFTETVELNHVETTDPYLDHTEIHTNTLNEGDDQDPVENKDSKEEEEEEEEAKEEDGNGDAEEDVEAVEDALTAPDVDQGWAWVVLAAAFLGMTIFGTFTFSIGIFQAEILQAVEPDIQKTSWVGATHFSTLCMMGPFAGLIKNKLGSRRTVLMSSVIICLGMVAASLSVNVTQLTLTYGFITGVGTGMALNPMFICVTFYFERYRGFASGVIAAGAGTGMFVGGPILRQLMETYGLSGTFLIWGAVGLNIGVAGMVMRPSSLERRRQRGLEEEEERGVPGMRRVDSGLLASVSTLPSAGGYWGSVLGLSSVMVRGDTEAELPAPSSSHAWLQSQNLLEVPDVQDAIRSYSELSALSPEAMETAIRSTWLTHNFRSSQLSVGNSLDSVSTGRRRFSPRLFRKNGLKQDLERGKEAEEFSTHQVPALSKFTCGRGSCHAGADLFRILSNPGFALYMFSGSMWVFGESIVFSYLPTYAQAQGSSPFQAAILLTALGLTSTFSRLVVGFVASHPSVGPDLMHVGMLGLCGLFTLSFPLYSSTFTGQLAFAALYGLYSGGLASVINVVIISLTGVQYIALGFGLICFGQGIASLAGPPISGAIVHTGGSYDHVFLFSGSLLLLAGCSGFPMVLFKPRPPASPPQPEEDADVEKAGVTTPVKIRTKGENI